MSTENVVPVPTSDARLTGGGAPSGTHPRRAGHTPRKIGVNLVAVVVALVCVFPLVIVVITAFSPQSEVLSWPPKLLPGSWTLGNFSEVAERIPVGRQLLNTVAMSVGVAVLSLVLDSMIAYALTFIPFRGRGIFLVVLIATMMIPFQTLLVPLYDILATLGWTGTLAGLIIPRAADVAGIFLLRQFFLQVPKDLHSAATLDGASEFRVYRSVVLPNAVGGLLTLGLFNFINNWNDMLWPMVVANSAEQRTLTAGLALLNGTSMGTVPYGVTMAGSLISVLPLVVVFAVVQKRFIEGVATSGIKG
jgi:multiple sugar transport system permease protein